MQTIILIVALIAVIVAVIAGTAVLHEYNSKTLSVFVIIGGATAAITAAALISNYAMPQPTQMTHDAGTLDAVNTLFANTFSIVLITAPIVPVSLIISVAVLAMEHKRKK